MLNREGLERDCTLAIEHFGDIDKARDYINEEFASDYTDTERAEVFNAVVDKHEQRILNLQVVVRNDGQEVFRGIAQKWLDDNDGDDDVRRLITDCFYEGQASEHFISGLWEVRTMQ